MRAQSWWLVLLPHEIISFFLIKILMSSLYSEMQFCLHVALMVIINREFGGCFFCLTLHLDRDLTDYRRVGDKQSYKLTKMFAYFWLRKEITNLCLVANCLFFKICQKMKNHFFIRKTFKVAWRRKTNKNPCWSGLYLNQFSLPWPFTGCSVLAACEWWWQT